MLKLNKQFKELRKIRPSLEWKNKTREALLKELEATHYQTETRGVLDTIQGVFANTFLPKIAQPVGLVSFLVCALLIGGISSVASHDSKPGDSLYIAKIINEKTQFAFTFREENKIRLGLEFAQKRTIEIEEVLEEHNLQAEEKDKKIAKLTNDFKKEIKRVKAIQNDPKKTEESQDSQQIEEESEEDIQVFSAHLGKAQNGMQVSENNIEINKALDQAEALIDEKDYAGTREKIEEAQNMILESKAEENTKEENESPFAEALDGKSIENISGYGIITVDNSGDSEKISSSADEFNALNIGISSTTLQIATTTKQE